MISRSFRNKIESADLEQLLRWRGIVVSTIDMMEIARKHKDHNVLKVYADGTYDQLKSALALYDAEIERRRNVESK